ncbi:chaperonin 10-like protein [Zychaea mexicana]|uniref:chaperonin 10-like protein n=1 Tax=Zychaea mexicana TaxID=64656 RepID=UPI0022FEABC7|nr:chaperonin 10-like protein [Zychaea mexicana]KAI9498571.1 chaperonin 10-like protein [Zychaea mexicana]
MSAQDNTFHGWVCNGKGQPLEWRELSLKKFEDDDLEIDVTHCGICGSDIHTLDSGWGSTNYPCVVGHEIVGVVTKLGKNVTEFKVGDRVGIGAQCDSCGECHECKNGHENICRTGMTTTYDGRWKCGDKTYGGYADKWRGNKNFVFKIPDDMSNELASTFFCAGVTTYWPLKNHGVNEQSHIGVIGLGGLGHFTVMWAKAMGAKVTVFSSSDRKREDAFVLGADDYVVSSDSEAVLARDRQLSHLVCTSFGNNFDWLQFLSMLEPNGVFIMAANPETPLSNIPAGILLMRQISIVGTAIGSPKTIRKMLEFAAEKNVKPWIEKYPMEKVVDAIQDLRDNKARYRYVLQRN